MSLPAAAGGGHPGERDPTPAPDMHRDPLRVLHLEASAADHEAVRHACAGSGLSLSFERASNRVEYEAALRAGAVDLVIVNATTPAYDALAALEAARSVLPGVPVIVVSSPIGEDRAAECLKRGASDFVLKERLERLPGALAAAAGSTEGHWTEAVGRFREMAESIRDVFWVCAAGNGRVLYVSPAYEGIWGQPAAAILASQSRWPASVAEEDRESVAQAQRRLDEGSPYQVEYRIQRPDGSVRWIRDRGFPVPGAAGRTVGVAADITEHKKLEADLVQSQKMELVGQLAGGVAHDFNNLLTIILGYVGMLLDRESIPPEVAEPLKRVFTAGRQATGLVRQLLLFSRKRAPKREVIDLNAELELMTGMLRRLLGETVKIGFEPARESPRVNADLAMLEQVLINLAINARDAMSRGGRLTISVEIQGRDHARISVRDTGSGIPASILPRIFEPFYTTKEEGRGTGLGLATAQDIVKRHDGWMEVDSEPGKGTVFRILLPLTRAQVKMIAADPGRGPAPGSKGTVLIVEDEANVREFAAAVLQQSGYSVLQGKSGEHAMEVWKWHSGKIDLLLTDVVLPGEWSGPELGTKLRQDKPTLRVLLTTGYSREAVAPSTEEGEEPRLLGKPYTPRALVQAVREAMV